MNDPEKMQGYLERVESRLEHVESHLARAAAIQVEAARGSVRDRTEFNAKLNEMMMAFQRQNSELRKYDAKREQERERREWGREQEREKREQERVQEREKLEREHEQEREKLEREREQEREKLEQERERERAKLERERAKLEREREQEYAELKQEHVELKQEHVELKREREQEHAEFKRERKQEHAEFKQELAELKQEQARLKREREKLEREREQKNEKREREWERLKELVGGMGETQGRLAEDFFYEALLETWHIGPLKFRDIRPNLRINHRGRSAEYDLVLTGRKHIAIVEVKLRLRKTDVEKVHKKLLPSAKRLLHEVRGRILVPVVAGMTVDADAVALAHQYGYVVLTPDGQKVRTDMQYLRYIPCPA